MTIIAFAVVYLLTVGFVGLCVLRPMYTTPEGENDQ